MTTPPTPERFHWARAYAAPDNRSFVCGYCGDGVSSIYGFPLYSNDPERQVGGIWLCHRCWNPTYFSLDGEQIPGVAFGGPVSNVPEDVNGLYEEARRCTSTNCFTSAVMLCRKILMNVAVNCGAKQGLKYAEYVDYLASENYLPKNWASWIGHIREMGNVANHEIRQMGGDDARQLITFVEMLLKSIYEFPNRISAGPTS